MKASVFLLTYNHGPFIEQAVRSALAQQTRFDYEVVVGDDASDDGTADTVRRLHAEYPGRVRPLLRARNVGMHRNFIETYRACAGEYVAYLDGDDYWTSPDKLQRQVEFLDAHPGHSFCFHDVRTCSADPAAPAETWPGLADRTTFTIEELILDNFVPSCSIVARNRLIEQFPGWVEEIIPLDWVFSLLNARHGPVGYLPETMAVYRRHAGGVWTTAEGERRREQLQKLYRRLPDALGPRYARVIAAAAERIELWYGNVWLRDQLEQSIGGYNTTQAWVQELARAKEWLAAQVQNYERTTEGLRAECEELKRGHEGLRAELHGSQERLDASARARAELEARNAVLASALQAVEQSRGWRLLCQVRRLRGLLRGRRAA
jgi:glycosyltransferase involved in cell wall biosynthesis